MRFTEQPSSRRAPKGQAGEQRMSGQPAGGAGLAYLSPRLYTAERDPMSLRSGQPPPSPSHEPRKKRGKKNKAAGDGGGQHGRTDC